MSKYNPSKIERKWQKYWATKKFYNTKDRLAGKKNYMLLTEFAYPSGNLHIGHWYAFALPDIKARYLRMKGYNVMYPTGFDAFGLPAENAAIKHGIHPEKWTKKNIAYMTKQLGSMGATFDWSRKVETIDPQYYKWTQWIFLKFFEKGLAYRAQSVVNWCPKDKTVLANEQVVGGACDRCGTDVVQKEIEQWMFKITEYADDLIDGLKDLNWQETAKLGQVNWIGRSEGATIKFKFLNFSNSNLDYVETFTTRPDTLYGVSAVVVSPELADKWIKGGWEPARPDESGHSGGAGEDVREYIKKALSKRELERQETSEKSGVPTGINVANPANGDSIPVWVADYVLGHYGTGAVMSVPAHDQRDFEFATKFNLPIKRVVLSTEGDVASGAFVEEGRLMNSGEFNGFTSEDARRKITESLKKKGLGDFVKTYRLHDWILSRQRYWGVPIPVIKCPGCGNVPVPEKDLPVRLPPLKDFKPSDDGRSPLAKAKSWLKVKCPECGAQAERETDTMDTFVDSSWYFMRYTDPKNKKIFVDKAKMDNWLPVPMYIGGAEHTTMHLLYSRFFTKALHSLGHINFSEPFKGRINRGIILGPDGQKMSKSRGNVIDPDVEVKNYGADTVRMYLSFMGPFEQGGPWDPKGINGVFRFLKRVWNLVGRYDVKTKPNMEAIKILNKGIKEIGNDLEGLGFNTGVSGLMKLINELESHQLSKKEYETFLKLLAPFAPHIAEELWFTVLKNKKSIHLEKWPEYDAKLSADEKIKIVIQLNGKMRDVIEVEPTAGEQDIKKIALSLENVKKHIGEMPIRKVIYVKGRVLNIVI